MKKTFTTLLILVFGILLVSCSKETYIITFDTDGGSVIHELERSKNDLVIKPADPFKEGYDFLFWVDKETNQKFDFDNIIVIIKCYFICFMLTICR